MQVHTYTEQLPEFRKAVVTIGTFDGVHLGHRKIISQLQEEADAIGGETIIITFHPHPRNVVKNAEPVRLISTIEERIELLRSHGIDHMVIVPFTESFSTMPATEYVEEFLIRRFHPHTVIIGYDHRFGNRREGDFRLMEKYSAQNHFWLKEIPAQIIDNNTVSSTEIRKSIREGNIALANNALGYSFFFSGIVVKGNQLGRKLGFPTINLSLKDAQKLVPGDGVYAVWVSASDDSLAHNKLGGMMSIGIRPTIQDSERTIEVNIFDFKGDLYDREIRVELVQYLRPELKFGSLDELIEQMKKDEARSREFLGLVNH